MNSKLYICIICLMFQLVLVQCSKIYCSNKTKHLNTKYQNPKFVKGRFKIGAPGNGSTNCSEEATSTTESPVKSWMKNFSRKPFHPGWMDYCDPYHCNDYHKTACGLNRKTMRFKWFQSACHIIMNNKCSHYRGSLKYDMIDTKFCMAYVMFLRSNCEPCTDEVESQICAISVTDYHTVLFKNKCAMKMANCAPATLNEYKQVEMQVCTLFQLYNMKPEYYNPMSSKLLL